MYVCVSVCVCASVLTREQCAQVCPLSNLSDNEQGHSQRVRCQGSVSPPPPLAASLPPSLLCCVCSVVSSSLTPHRGFPVRLLRFPVPVQNGTAYWLFLQNVNNWTLHGYCAEYSNQLPKSCSYMLGMNEVVRARLNQPQCQNLWEV